MVNTDIISALGPSAAVLILAWMFFKHLGKREERIVAALEKSNELMGELKCVLTAQTNLLKNSPKIVDNFHVLFTEIADLLRKINTRDGAKEK